MRLAPLLLMLVIPMAGAQVPSAVSSLSGAIWAQEDQKKDPTKGRKTKRTATMREQVFKKLSEAQTAAEAEDFDTALKALRGIEKVKNLSPYEMAQLHNFYAYIYYTQDDYDGAIRSYKTVLAQPDLPEALQNGTLFSLAQLLFVQENYTESEKMLLDWFDKVAAPNAQSYVMLAQCRYSMDKFREALEPMNTAINMAETEKGKAEENWYSLLRVLHYELEDYPATAQVLETLVRLYPKKEYWLQLAGMYGEMEQSDKQMVVLDLAYRAGYFSKSSEYTNLAQLLLQEEIPYRAAQILEDGFQRGHVDEKVNNLRLLSQAYVMAQEDEKALKPLESAAELDEDGELYMHLANSLYNLNRFKQSEEAAREALRKGLKRPSEARITLGMALYEQDKLDAAKKAFRDIKEKRNQKMAAQWINFIEREQARIRQLEEAIAANAAP
ncbi:MAG: tetratricopeptide repeat protein [Xanthomonadales bacterium]|nr:tetratricopeptide repeat protein [Xanthomonadales bacterium]